MFAIDCLKANGTHLGTCIDRFYFGSCCHIEHVKDLDNTIESNIVLDSRVPPHRVQNTTTVVVSTTTPITTVLVTVIYCFPSLIDGLFNSRPRNPLKLRKRKQLRLKRFPPVQYQPVLQNHPQHHKSCRHSSWLMVHH